MPQPGEIRRGATESVQWDGSRWQPVHPDAGSPGTPGLGSVLAHPLDTLAGIPSGAMDLARGAVHHPADVLKGFFSGAAEGAPTAARIAQAAIPMVTGGASIPAQMAVGAGLQGVADIADRAAGDPSAPQTFTDYLEHAATGAIAPAVLGVAGKAYNAIKGSGGMVDAALGVGSHVPGLKTVSRLAKAARTFGGAVSDEAPAAEEALSGFAQQPKATYINRPDAPYAGSAVAREPRPVSFGSGGGPSGATVKPPAGKAPGLSSALNDILEGLRTEGDAAPMKPADTPVVRSADRGNMLSDAEAHNIERNAPYGYGQVMPGPRPTELRTPSMEGLDHPQVGPVTDLGFYGMPTPKGVDMEFLGGGPESGRFPTPTSEGQAVPSDEDVNALVSKLMPQADAAPQPAAVSSLDGLSSEPVSFYKSRPDAVGEAYRGAKAGRAADPSSVNPLAEKQLGVSLQRTAQDAGLPTRGPGNLDKFLNDWILPQLTLR